MAIGTQDGRRLQRPAETKFKDMSARRKVVWISKFLVFLCSFGFAFPLIMSD
jgi:hypothetical protein